MKQFGVEKNALFFDGLSDSIVLLGDLNSATDFGRVDWESCSGLNLII